MPCLEEERINGAAMSNEHGDEQMTQAIMGRVLGQDGVLLAHQCPEVIAGDGQWAACQGQHLFFSRTVKGLEPSDQIVAQMDDPIALGFRNLVADSPKLGRQG